MSRPSALLRPPPTASRPSRHFPGAPVIGGHRFPGRSPGAEEALSSSHGNLVTVPRPIRRRVPRHALQDLTCRPWPSPSKVRARHPLGPLTRVSVTTPQASLHAADRPLARPLTGTLLLRFDGGVLTRRREPRYRGPWRLPGPDSHRLATVSLSLGYAIAPSPLFGVRAAGRTLRPEEVGAWRSFR